MSDNSVFMPSLARSPLIVINKVSPENLLLQTDIRSVCESYGVPHRIVSLSYDKKTGDLAYVGIVIGGKEVKICLLSPGIDYTLKFSEFCDTNPPSPISYLFNRTR